MVAPWDIPQYIHHHDNSFFQFHWSGQTDFISFNFYLSIEGLIEIENLFFQRRLVQDRKQHKYKYIFKKKKKKHKLLYELLHNYFAVTITEAGALSSSIGKTDMTTKSRAHFTMSMKNRNKHASSGPWFQESVCLGRKDAHP